MWRRGFFEEGHTTHLSTADARGGAVALTQSNGPSMGSRVATPGLGFVYAATMGYLGRTAPGHRAPSSISPFMVLRDGKPVYVLGAAGARRIVTSIVEAVSRAIDRGLSLDRAVSAARIHPEGDSVLVEVGPGRSWQPADLDALRAAGLDIGTRSSGPYFGRIHGIFLDLATGELTGVADPRWDGSAAGPATTLETRR
jgi:gamma-glutamyltranspeptidase/glutathione hydrolase